MADFNGQSVVERLQLCKDILTLQDRIKTAPEAKKIEAKALGARRISAMRAVLLGKPGRTLADDLMSPTLGPKKLLAVLDSLDGKTDAEKARAVLYVRGIQEVYDTMAQSEERAGLLDRSEQHAGSTAVRARLTQLHALVAEPDCLTDESIAVGKLSDELRDEVVAANVSAAGRFELKADQLAPELLAKEADLSAEANAIYTAVSKIQSDYNRWEREEGDGALDEATAAKREEWKKAYKDKWAEYNKTSAAIDALWSEQRDAVKKRQNELMQPMIEVGKKIIEAVASASPVTDKEAADWAASQEITPPAAARLKKTGYPVEQVRKDMAEFYRFSGGRVSSIRVHSKGDRRANATSIDEHGTGGTIHLDSAFDKRVLWHEMAHHIEADPVARAAAGRMIRRRSVDGKAHTLRSLTGSKAYRGTEVAYKNGFFTPYVGKIYRDGMTEVFAMGVESFSDPAVLAKRVADDPQTLEFVAGFLKSPVDPLAAAYLKLRDGLKDAKTEAKEEAANMTGSLLEKLAAQAPAFEKTVDAPWASTVNWAFGDKAKAIGRVGEWVVVSLPVTNWGTRRKMAGLTLVQNYSGDDNDPRLRYSDRYIGKDVNIVRAAYAVFQKQGRWPNIQTLQQPESLLSLTS